MVRSSVITGIITGYMLSILRGLIRQAQSGLALDNLFLGYVELIDPHQKRQRQPILPLFPT